MDEEKKVGAPAGEYAEEEKTADEAASNAGANEGADLTEKSAESATAETTPKVGDACICPDGRAGTLSESAAEDGSTTLVCLANQG